MTAISYPVLESIGGIIISLDPIKFSSWGASKNYPLREGCNWDNANKTVVSKVANNIFY